MKVCVFFKSAQQKKLELPLKYMSNSISSSENSIKVCNIYGLDYVSCDLAIFFGSWKNRDRPHHNLKRKIVSSVENFIVIETPIIGRGKVTNSLNDEWFRIGINGFLNHTGNFNNKDCKNKRWQEIKKKFKLDLKPWRDNSNKGPIVLVLQLPGDASMCNIDVNKWALFCVKTIRSLTSRQILIRKPQLERNFQLSECLKYSDVSIQSGTYENKIQTFESAWVTVTFSSVMGVESIINGCPTIAMHPASFAFEISSNSLDEIEKPKMPDRSQWLNNLSYTTWSLNEIKKGLPWKHLKNQLKY